MYTCTNYRVQLSFPINKCHSKYASIKCKTKSKIFNYSLGSIDFKYDSAKSLSSPLYDISSDSFCCICGG